MAVAGWLTAVLKETRLKMDEELPDFGWNHYQNLYNRLQVACRRQMHS